MTDPVSIRILNVQARLAAYFAQHEVEPRPCDIRVDEDFGENSLAVYRPPNTVLIKPNATESIVAHELVHAAQQTLEVFRGFKHLYSVLSEGLAEFVAKQLYPEHQIRYQIPYELVSIMYELHRGIMKEIIGLDRLKLVPEDIDLLIESPKVHSYFKQLIRSEATFLKENIERAIQSGIDDPTFISMGEDLRAWKFLLSSRFDSERDRINFLLDAYFKDD